MSVQRMFEKSLMVYQIFLDPPKSPLKRGTLTLVPPLARGLGGICKCLKSQPKTFQTPSYRLYLNWGVVVGSMDNQTPCRITFMLQWGFGFLKLLNLTVTTASRLVVKILLSRVISKFKVLLLSLKALPDWLWLFNNKKISKSSPGKDFINPKIQI